MSGLEPTEAISRRQHYSKDYRQLYSRDLSAVVVQVHVLFGFIGQFYASFSWRHTQLPDVKADGYYMSLFLDTKTCEILSGWMLINGGLVSD